MGLLPWAHNNSTGSWETVMILAVNASECSLHMGWPRQTLIIYNGVCQLHEIVEPANKTIAARKPGSLYLHTNTLVTDLTRWLHGWQLCSRSLAVQVSSHAIRLLRQVHCVNFCHQLVSCVFLVPKYCNLIDHTSFLVLPYKHEIYTNLSRHSSLLKEENGPLHQLGHTEAYSAVEFLSGDDDLSVCCQLDDEQWEELLFSSTCMLPSTSTCFLILKMKMNLILDYLLLK